MTIDLPPTSVSLIHDLYGVGAVDRHYHNLDHAWRVAHECEYLCTEMSLPELVFPTYVAGMWHDAVYVPGAADNEELSAAAMLRVHPQFHDIAQLIRQTTISHHLSSDITWDTDKACCILLDADLMSLADDYPMFIETQYKILKEHSATDLSLSATFLQKFLQKPNIYRSTAAYVECEDKARDNIARLFSEYGTK